MTSRKAFTDIRSTASCACRLPAQRQFSIPQRKDGGHWDDFEIVRKELQPFLHIVKPGPESYRQSAETGSLALDDGSLIRGGADALCCSSSQNAGNNGASTQASDSSSTATVSCSNSQTKGGNSTESGQAQEQPQSSTAISKKNGVELQHRMPTQQELIAAGRMDLLNAMRVWGGFTAVADLMGVHPNTRYPHSPGLSPSPVSYPSTVTACLWHSLHIALCCMVTSTLHVHSAARLIDQLTTDSLQSSEL